MKKIILTLIVLLTAFIVGCGGDTMYVCSTGDQVSNPDLCPEITETATSTLPTTTTTKTENPPLSTVTETKQDLIGTWDCNSDTGESTLVFKSTTEIVIGNQNFNYELIREKLKIWSNAGEDEYTLIVNDNELTMSYSDGWEMQCTKSSDEITIQPTSQVSGGEESQIEGTYCQSAVGSPFHPGTYSRESKIALDGKGNFVYGEEVSYSGPSGLYYDPNSYQGTYKVEGNDIYFTFNDGTFVHATVYVRQNNGFISEFVTQNRDLYAIALCNIYD